MKFKVGQKVRAKGDRWFRKGELLTIVEVDALDETYSARVQVESGGKTVVTSSHYRRHLRTNLSYSRQVLMYSTRRLKKSMINSW